MTPTATFRLSDIAHGRSGDKGNHANVAIIAYTPAGFAWLREHLTAETVERYFSAMKPSRVERFEAANVLGVNFLLRDGLAGGASQSLRIDTQGKTLATAILQMPIERPNEWREMLDFAMTPSSSLPTCEEINVFDSLDERAACARFLGKNVREAEILFHEHHGTLLDQIGSMGPRAFRYYIFAALSYIHSEESTDDPMVIRGLAGIVDHWLSSHPEELEPITKPLISMCGFILEQWGKFGLHRDEDRSLNEDYCLLQRALRGQATDEEKQKRLALAKWAKTT